MLVDIIAFTVLLAVCLALVYSVFGSSGIRGVKTGFIMLNHSYGMLILIWLLGYGVSHLPLHIFSKSLRNYAFYKDVAKTASVYEAYRDSQVELYRHSNV